ncbi:MAG: site-specific integrase [Chitinophagaceae bacterium]
MKTTQTFNVHYVALIKKSNRKMVTIYARITISKQVLDISLRKNILYSQWDSKKESVAGKSPEAKQINKFVDDTRYRLMECYQQLLLEHKVISPHSIKSLFLGETKTDNKLCALIHYHNTNMKNVLSYGTLKNYYTTEKYIKKFLAQKHKNADIFLSALNYQFITEFEFYLRTCHPLQRRNMLNNNGIMKHMERLKKMVTLAYKMEWINKDPFAQYKLRFKRREMSFLNAEELFKIEHANLYSNKLERSRDLFVFSCYTGLSYIDLTNLRTNHLCVGIDGEYWINTSRQKTETPVNIPLLPKAYELIQKYKMNQ